MNWGDMFWLTQKTMKIIRNDCACNPDKYDVIRLSELGSIDWTQSHNIVVGDIVYIYVSNTVRTIKVKCKVNAVAKQYQL